MSDDYQSVLLWKRFLQFSQGVTRTGAAIIQSHGLTPPQFLLMMHLCEGETPPTQKALAQALTVTEGNISQMLKVMERNGWIVREQCELGKRILLTDTAKHLYANVNIEHTTFIRRVYGALTPEDGRIATALLDQLEHALSQHTHTKTRSESTNNANCT